MNIESCEKVYGKLLREDENHWYFEGLGRIGVCIPKKAYWSFERVENQCRICQSSYDNEKEGCVCYECRKKYIRIPNSLYK